MTTTLWSFFASPPCPLLFPLWLVEADLDLLCLVSPLPSGTTSVLESTGLSTVVSLRRLACMNAGRSTSVGGGGIG